MGERDIVIRTYEPTDQERVWSLHVEGLHDTRSVVAVGQEFDEDLRRIETVYLRDGSHFWVMEEGGQVVGMVGVRRKDDATAEIRRMRVGADCRRRGLGQRLLEVAEDFCRRYGYRHVILDTTDRQRAARRLYERNGYEVVGAMPIPPLTLFFYRKELS